MAVITSASAVTVAHVTRTFNGRFLHGARPETVQCFLCCIIQCARVYTYAHALNYTCAAANACIEKDASG